MAKSEDRKFPSCRHAKRGPAALPFPLWIASEPFRIFFLTGICWSIVGVMLWPLAYLGKLSFAPHISHARLMIECFGGGFVLGFLGTAGPRMASAPKLSLPELGALLLLHLLNGAFHAQGKTAEGDATFLALLALFTCSLVFRVVKFRTSAPPPQLLLALSGLLSGMAGVMIFLNMESLGFGPWYRFGGLLLNQGMLLLPVLGIGSFLFPRMLGGTFGESVGRREYWMKFSRALVVAGMVIGSFAVEAWGAVGLGYGLRLAAAVGYLLAEIQWHRDPDAPARGTLAKGLYWALASGACGLGLAGFFYERHVAVEHLLYIGGFGLLMLVVASRVLFGHSGDLEGFSKKSWMARTLIFLAILTALTRATADFFPNILVSHYKYAAWTWALTAVLWVWWHRSRFRKRDPD